MMMTVRENWITIFLVVVAGEGEMERENALFSRTIERCACEKKNIPTTVNLLLINEAKNFRRDFNPSLF